MLSSQVVLLGRRAAARNALLTRKQQLSLVAASSAWSGGNIRPCSSNAFTRPAGSTSNNTNSWTNSPFIAAAAAATALFASTYQMDNDDNLLDRKQIGEALRAEVGPFRTSVAQTRGLSLPKIKIGETESGLQIQFETPSYANQSLILNTFFKKVAESHHLQQLAVQAQYLDDGAGGNIKSYVYGKSELSFHHNVVSLSTPGDTISATEVSGIAEAYKASWLGPNTAWGSRRRSATNNKDYGNSPRIINESRRRQSTKGLYNNDDELIKEESNPALTAAQELETMGIRVYNVQGSSSTKEENKDALTWDALAGYDEIKTEIQDTLVLALQNPEVYESIARRTRCRYESNRPRAILFEGPPGTGKSLSARIIATQAGVPMVHIPLETVVSKYYGEAEKNMSKIFNACSKFPDGAIIFIDEVDALAGDRGSGNMHEASRRILSVLLQKLEGFEGQNDKTTLLCATNRKFDMDAAMLSRFGLVLKFDLPTIGARVAIYSRYAKHLKKKDVESLAQMSDGFSCRDIKEICEQAERKCASSVLKLSNNGTKTVDLPTLETYKDAVTQRIRNSFE